MLRTYIKLKRSKRRRQHQHHHKKGELRKMRTEVSLSLFLCSGALGNNGFFARERERETPPPILLLRKWIRATERAVLEGGAARLLYTRWKREGLAGRPKAAECMCVYIYRRLMQQRYRIALLGIPLRVRCVYL